MSAAREVTGVAKSAIIALVRMPVAVIVAIDSTEMDGYAMVFSFGKIS